MIKSRNTALIGLVLTAVLWSTGGMLIKAVNGHPMAIASFRTLIATLVFLLYKGFKLKKLDQSGWLMAICYALTMILFVAATKMTTAANAIFLQFTASIWVAVFSKVFLKHRLRKSDLISIGIIVLSMGLFFINKFDTSSFLGNLMGLGAGLSFAGFITLASTKKEGTGIYPVIYGSILTFLVGLPFYTPAIFQPISVGAVLLLGIFQIGLSYVLYTKSMEFVTAVDGILIPVIEPILNPIWVMLTINEVPTIYALIGGLIMIITITLRAIHQTKYKNPILQNPIR